MDRLVCGDVGFGKTEVAMRAAFRVAMRAASRSRALPDDRARVPAALPELRGAHRGYPITSAPVRFQSKQRSKTR
jgi:transcription-repair coupling factor (superfamily II helicase)